MTPLELTGRSEHHLVDVAEAACRLHAHAAVPFLNLRRAAAAAGFDLRVASGFRGFERQLALWNGKWRGQRPLLDASGRPVDATDLAATERVTAILRWSALPGASRHHWGTDIDVYDAASVADDYRVELTAWEFSSGGPFFELGRWLDQNAHRYGFFRPFRGVLSGVQAEPWHLSFAPVADGARRALGVPELRAALADAAIEGREEVILRLAEIHGRYVASIDWP